MIAFVKRVSKNVSSVHTTMGSSKEQRLYPPRRVFIHDKHIKYGTNRSCHSLMFGLVLACSHMRSVEENSCGMEGKDESIKLKSSTRGHTIRFIRTCDAVFFSWTLQFNFFQLPISFQYGGGGEGHFCWRIVQLLSVKHRRNHNKLLALFWLFVECLLLEWWMFEERTLFSLSNEYDEKFPSNNYSLHL